MSYFELGFAGWLAKSLVEFLELDPGPWEGSVGIKGAFGEEDMNTFAESPRLQTIRVLELRNNAIWDEAGVRFATSPQLKQLISLKLGWNKFCDAGAVALAACRALNGLKVFDISGNAINEGIVSLIHSPLLGCLTHLDLSDNGVNDLGAEAIAQSTTMSKLVSLQLKQTGIGDAGAIALASSPHLNGLTSLNLSKNSLGEQGSAAISARFPFVRL